MKLTLIVLAFLVALTTSATAGRHAVGTLRLANDRGGLITGYVEKFRSASQRGVHAVVDGDCLSACTMAIGFFQGRICATPRAVLGFHSPSQWGKQPNPQGTQMMASHYTAAALAWIARNGGLQPEMIFLRGPELYAVVPACGGQYGQV
jgi:hypothetical protein